MQLHAFVYSSDYNLSKLGYFHQLHYRHTSEVRLTQNFRHYNKESSVIIMKLIKTLVNNITWSSKKQAVIKLIYKAELTNSFFRKIMIIKTVEQGSCLIIPYPVKKQTKMLISQKDIDWDITTQWTKDSWNFIHQSNSDQIGWNPSNHIVQDAK